MSASVFVPKPHTPFEWAAQLNRETIHRRQQMLRQALATMKGVDFKYHEMDVSFVEAAFARGDRE